MEIGAQSAGNSMARQGLSVLVPRQKGFIDRYVLGQRREIYLGRSRRVNIGMNLRCTTA